MSMCVSEKDRLTQRFGQLVLCPSLGAKWGMAFSDSVTLPLLTHGTHGTENVQDIFGPHTVFLLEFHSGGSPVNIHRARSLLYA